MRRPLLAITIPFYLLDQITKWLVLLYIEPGREIPVIPDVFNLVQVHNTGAAFGMLANNNAFFLGLSAVAAVALLIFWRRGAFRDRWTVLGAALLLAGILGNFTDRVRLGFVVDFLDFTLPWYGRWPSFNVADSCICVAAGLFVIASIFEKKSERVIAD